MFPRCYSQPQLSTGWSKDGLKHPHCAPSSELGSGLLLEAVMSTAAPGTLLGSVGSAAQEFSGCPVTKTFQNPQGAEPWLCLAGQVCSDTRRSHWQDLLLIPAASSPPQELLPGHHSTSQTPEEPASRACVL